MCHLRSGIGIAILRYMVARLRNIVALLFLSLNSPSVFAENSVADFAGAISPENVCEQNLIWTQRHAAVGREQLIYELQSPSGMDFNEYSLSESQRSSRDLVDKAGGTHLVTIQGTNRRDFRITRIFYDNFVVEIVRPIVHEYHLPSYDRLLTPQEIAEFWHLKNPFDVLPDKSKIDMGWYDPNFHFNYVDIVNRELLKKTILEQLDFVLKRYSTEKPWPPSFLQRLVKIAFQYAHASTYISVRSLTPEGIGEIIGSVRLIEAPFVNMEAAPIVDGVTDPRTRARAMELLRNEFSLFSRGLKIDLNKEKLKNIEIWKQIFGTDEVQFGKTDLDMPAVRMQGHIAYVPAPFEDVLNREFVRERGHAGAELQNFIEPGNFAITPDRELEPRLRGMASAALYFHLARLIRKESGASGKTSHVGTYASDRSSSDRFYRSLGFQLKEQISPVGVETPTPEKWNVLMGDDSVLQSALLTRFGPNLTAEHVNRKFGIFDQFDVRKTPENQVHRGRFEPYFD